jgi:hypothetical protein
VKALLFLPLGAIALAGYVYAGHHIGLSSGGNQITGNGILKTQNRQVAPYSKIVIGSAFVGQFFETTPGPLTLSAESNVLPLIETKVENDTLYVNIKGSMSLKRGLRITGRTAKISSVDASGASQIELKNIGRHALTVKGSGASKVSVFGAPNSLKLDASGASQMKFGNLTLETLVADLSGASNLTLAGTVQNATVSASGASTFAGNISGGKFRGTASGASNLNISGHFTTCMTSASGASQISRPY